MFELENPCLTGDKHLGCYMTPLEGVLPHLTPLAWVSPVPTPQQRIRLTQPLGGRIHSEEWRKDPKRGPCRLNRHERTPLTHKKLPIATVVINITTKPNCGNSKNLLHRLRNLVVISSLHIAMVVRNITTNKNCGNSNKQLHRFRNLVAINSYLLQWW
jgi:hypothetical protein